MMVSALAESDTLPTRALYLGIQQYTLPLGRLTHALARRHSFRGWLGRRRLPRPVRWILEGLRELVLVANDYGELRWRLWRSGWWQRRGWLLVSDRGPRSIFSVVLLAKVYEHAGAAGTKAEAEAGATAVMPEVWVAR